MKSKDGFVRDSNNPGAVLNVDNAALKAYKLQKKVEKNKENEIKELKQEIGEIKEMFTLLLSKLNKS